MNDRYLYRAKRIGSPNAGEWVKGTYVHTNLGREMICDGTTYIGINRPCMIDIDISTLCACTGLKDRNGKLIWENDIVQYRDCTIENYVIAWETNKACFEYQQYGCSIMDFEELSGIEVEVIGNIFDNAELLEVGE